MLEEKHDHVAQIKQNRQKQEQDLTDVQSMYKQLQNNVNKERKKGFYITTPSTLMLVERPQEGLSVVTELKC